jgi:translation initiation factor 1A
MGKNRKGGKKRKKGKNSEEYTDKDIVFKEDGLDYGLITKVLGNRCFEVYCLDGETRFGILRGGIKKKVWIASGDLVLYSIRDFQDNKIDIVHKYTNDDVQTLYNHDEINNMMYKMYKSDVSNTDYDSSSHHNDVEFIDEEGVIGKECDNLID